MRPNRVYQVAEIADGVDVGAKFPRLAALGQLSSTYQAGEVGTEMSSFGGGFNGHPQRTPKRSQPRADVGAWQHAPKTPSVDAPQVALLNLAHKIQL